MVTQGARGKLRNIATFSLIPSNVNRLISPALFLPHTVTLLLFPPQPETEEDLQSFRDKKKYFQEIGQWIRKGTINRHFFFKQNNSHALKPCWFVHF